MARAFASSVAGRSASWLAPTDSTAALQALIDAGAGGTVVIPGEIYFLGSPIVLEAGTHDNTTIDWNGSTLIGTSTFYSTNSSLNPFIELRGGEASAGSCGTANTGGASLATGLTKTDAIAAVTEGDTTITAEATGDTLPAAPFWACIAEADQGSNTQFNIREWVYVTAVDTLTLTVSAPIGRDFSGDAILRWKTNGADPLLNVTIQDLFLIGHDSYRGGYTDKSNIRADLCINPTFRNIRTWKDHGYSGEINACHNATVNGWEWGDSLDTSGAGGTAYGLVIHGGRGHNISNVGNYDASNRRGAMFLGGCHDVDIDNYRGQAYDAAYSTTNVNSLDLHGKGEYDIRITNCSAPQISVGSHYRGCTKIRVSDSTFTRAVNIAPGADDVEFTDCTLDSVKAVRRTTTGYNPDGSAKTIGALTFRGCTIGSYNHDPAMVIHEVDSLTCTDCTITFDNDDFGGSTGDVTPAITIDCWLADGDPDTASAQPGLPVRHDATMFSAASLSAGVKAKNYPNAYNVGGTYTFRDCTITNAAGSGAGQHQPVIVGTDVAAVAQALATISFNACTFGGKTATAVRCGSETTGGTFTSTNCTYDRTGGTATGILTDASGNLTATDTDPVLT